MSRFDELIKELCPDGVEYREISTAVNIVGGKDYKNLKCIKSVYLIRNKLNIS